MVLLALIPAAASAAENADLSRRASLTVDYRFNGDEPVPGAEFSLYGIGSVSETGEASLDARVAAYGVGLNPDDWSTASRTVYGYLQRDEAVPAAQGKTGADGRLVFGDLSPGLYLLAGGAVSAGGYAYEATEPAILALPGLTGGGVWKYDITVSPKCERQKESGPDEVSRRAVKVWKDDKGESRPKQISVQLLRDGKVFDTRTLSAENNWRYEWSGLDAGREWLVVEKTVPAGYTVSVARDGITFIVTNTREETTTKPSETTTKPSETTTKPSETTTKPSETTTRPSETTTRRAPETTTRRVPETTTRRSGETTTSRYKEKEEPDLPQTGLNWWPVFISAAAGLAFVTAGVCLRSKIKKDD